MSRPLDAPAIDPETARFHGFETVPLPIRANFRATLIAGGRARERPRGEIVLARERALP